jgi:hypothetical protein
MTTTKKRFAYLPWFPSDFAGATRGWPCCARLIFRELLDAAWDMGGLPNDPDELREIVRLDAACFDRGWRYVASKFEPRSDGKLYNPRLEEHRVRSQELSEKRSKAGVAGNQKRWSERGSH